MLKLAALLLLFSAQSVRAQHGTVGRPCEVSTDCGTGNYCAGNKRCACLTTYVEIDSYCWRKINPGESGCTQNRQCEAVWPGAYCRSGECRCANNQPPFRTRDGLVCLNYGFCPLNGNNPKFRIENQVQQCYGGADATCEAIGALAYDCICDSDDCTVNNPISFCCPSRAFACIQPPNEGYTPPGGGTTLNHWYHDPITGECRELKYQGYGGNANNFQTKDHCESYCKQTCNRGLPLYRDRTTGVKQEPVYCQGNDNGCNNPNYQCTTMGTLQQCCPTYLFICSRNGGIPSEVYNTAGGLPTEYFDVGIPDGSGNTSPRFYYDSREGRCIQFSYLGQGGNFNNFLSQDHCEKFCSRILCSAGEPLKDSSGERNMECSPTGSGANSCPSTHSCESTSGSTTFGGVCCPRPQYVCKLPREQGNCGTYSNRWWFNAKTGNCEEFIYSGCQGNANNFETYKECQDYCRDARSEPQCIQGTALTDSNGNFIICGGSSAASTTCPANHYCYYDGTTYGCCPTQAYTCSLSYKSGASCGPAVTRWYYDSTTRTCQTYSFNGCDGNSNNFATQQDCKDYCRVESCPDGGEVWKEQNGAARACTTNRQCPSTHYCTPVTTWTGTVYQTKSLCCPSKNFVPSNTMVVRVTVTTLPLRSLVKTIACRKRAHLEQWSPRMAMAHGLFSAPTQEEMEEFQEDVQMDTHAIRLHCWIRMCAAEHRRSCNHSAQPPRLHSSRLSPFNQCNVHQTSTVLAPETSSAGSPPPPPPSTPSTVVDHQTVLILDVSLLFCLKSIRCTFKFTTNRYKNQVEIFILNRVITAHHNWSQYPERTEPNTNTAPHPRHSTTPSRDAVPIDTVNSRPTWKDTSVVDWNPMSDCRMSAHHSQQIWCLWSWLETIGRAIQFFDLLFPPKTIYKFFRYARAGTPQSCPDNSACLYTGNDNGFICCRVQLGQGKS
ncbi:hypothetical protein CAEBREN_03914 [Caenorhabditis brenneri]|uniref:BPTI/Kunitz inhibitor domain-containing protein n=1 Tax=Caenorhabditis brenneri TaxID=135651 RepID=G0PB39_CAEBE|nr:hypothetical protein CAEBREN_03914 [Caenorhabditis brenneri]